LTEVTAGSAAFIEHIAQLAPESNLLESKLPLFGKLAAAAGLLESKRRPSARKLEPIITEARRVASDTDAAEPFRLAAVKLLGRTSKDDAPVLAKLLSPHHLPAIQKAALTALVKSEDIAVLIKEWKVLSPALRSEALTALLSRPDRAAKLVEALESGVIHPGELSVAQQNQLIKRADSARVERIFAARQTDRTALVQKYAGVKEGDARRGAELFAQHCATCHRFKGQGTELGPDLGMVANKSADALLIAILEPNRAMEMRYVSYNVTTKDGDEYSGVIASETANSVTLRAAGGVEKTFLRANIREISSAGLSVMPEGLETALPPAEMAHLIAYILSE
jgi:putative heme-binding domain-containing protein